MNINKAIKKLLRKIMRINSPILTRQGTKECFEDMPLKVQWQLTEACNYRCSYCCDRHRGYNNVFCTLEDAKVAINHIALANRPSYQVSLLGGEPTIHPYLPEIISLISEKLENRLEKITIVTNGNFSDKVMESIIQASNNTCIEIALSMHFEYLKMEQIRHIIKSVSNRTNIVFLIMFHPEYFDDICSVVEELFLLRSTYPFDIRFELINGIDKEHPYSTKHFKWIEAMSKLFKEIHQNSTVKMPPMPKEAGWEYLIERTTGKKVSILEHLSNSELKKKTGLRFKGMMCCAGTHIIHIGADGITKGLNCALANNSLNIYKENPFMDNGFMEAIKCTKKQCICNINWRTPKFLSKSEAEDFIEQCIDRQQKLIERSADVT